MNWLARLKKLENDPKGVPTKPTKPPFVGFVGALPGAFEKSAVNDDSCMARLTLFTDRGLSIEEGETLVQRLAQRDAAQDERKLCLECVSLSGGGGNWHCSQWRRIGMMRDAALPDELVMLLQRCVGFQDRLRGGE